MAARQIVTRAEFRTRLKYRLQNSRFWTDAELNQIINEILRTFNCYTGYWSVTTTLTTTQNLPYYSTQGILTMAARVSFNGAPLAQASVYSWDMTYPGWEGVPGTPEEWSPVGMALIALRKPDAVGSQSLQIDGIARTPVLADDADFVDVGQEQFQCLLDYGQHVCAFKEGGAEFASTMKLYENFLVGCADINARLRALANYRHIMGLDLNESDKPRRKRTPELTVGTR